jgi:hypothetical protein
MKKKSLWLFGILFILSVSYIGIVSSADHSCSIVQNSQCTGQGKTIILGLSSQTNAHIEAATDSVGNPVVVSSPYVLCCNWIASTRCLPDSNNGAINRVISAYPWTPLYPQQGETAILKNAHAEIPDFKPSFFYGWNICFDNLECVSHNSETNEPFDTSTFEVSMDLSLSLSTVIPGSNAHVGGFEDYPLKVYCRHRLEVSGTCADEGGEICGEGYFCESDGTSEGTITTSDSAGNCCMTQCKPTVNAYWSGNSEGGGFIEYAELNQRVYMVLDTSQPIGTPITFEVFKVGDTSNKVIESSSTTVQDYMGGRKAIVSWTVNDGDLDIIDEWENNEIDEIPIYFKASDTTSNILEVRRVEGPISSIIDKCSEYTTIESCNNNPEELNLDPNNVIVDWYYYDDLCQRRTIGDGCIWNEAVGKCNPKNTFEYPDPESEDANPPVCEEVMISCQYEETTSGSCGSGDEFERISYKLFKDQDQQCTEVPSKTVPCPDVKLIPFFDKIQLTLSIIIIGFIYAFIIYKKRE